MANLDLYKSTLAPWQGSVYDKFINDPNMNGKFWSQMAPYDHTQFDPNFSVQLMDYYNRSMNLGLTDKQIVDGINAFAQRSSKQWNEPKPLDASSNPVAVAAESIERALALAGKDSGAFWNAASPMLNQGQAMADQMYRYGMAQSGQEFQANEKDDSNFLDKAIGVIKAVSPIALGALIPGVGGVLMGAGSNALSKAADQNSFDGLLKDFGLGAIGGLAGQAVNSGLGGLFGDSAATGADFFGEGTPGATVDYGSGATGSAIGTGAAAGSGGTGMFDDIFDWLSDSFGDAASSGSEFASQDIVDLFNNAGTEGFNQYGVSLDDLATQLFDQAGTAGFDQYGNEAFGLDWLKSQLPSGTSSDTLAKLGKVLFGSGEAGSGGGLLGGTGKGQGSLLGALLGGLAGSYGGAKQGGTINTTQTPWGPQQPYLLDAWEKAKQASNNPINTQAQSNYQQVLGGPTTNPYLGMDNPYLQKQIDNTNADVTRAMMPAMNQANKASGSFGNSGVADIYSKNMTDAYSRNANDMRFKDYYAQMQLQKDAVNNTLGFTQGSSAFNAAPAQDYAKTVQGNYGGTKSEPYFTNPASSILGGATLGYNLFGS